MLSWEQRLVSNTTVYASPGASSRRVRQRHEQTESCVPSCYQPRFVRLSRDHVAMQMARRKPRSRSQFQRPRPCANGNVYVGTTNASVVFGFKNPIHHDPTAKAAEQFPGTRYFQRRRRNDRVAPLR